MTLPAYAMNQATFPAMYERCLVGPLFRPWVDVLLERARLARGDRVLDLACGTGIVARVAQERLDDTGQVVGVDVSPQMLDVARAIAPTIEWLEGNATALPVDATVRFDVVLCQQGLQFFPDKPAAAREMWRVLVPGGRLTLATWRPLAEIPCFEALHRVAERHLGAIADHRYSFGDATAIETLLANAGFHDVRVETVTRTVRLPDAALFVRMNAMALVGMSLASATMSDDERARVLDAITSESPAVLPPFADGDGLAVALSTNVASASR